MHKAMSLRMSFFNFFLFCLAANANAAQESLIQHINQINSTQTAKAFLSTNPHNGIDCSFTARSISNIEQLKKILQRARLKEVPELESHLPVIGLRLEFTLSNGNVMELAFGKEYYGEELVDGMVKGLSKEYGIYFLVHRSIYREIYNWTKQRGVIAQAYFFYPDGHYPLFCEKWKAEMSLSDENFQYCLLSRDREEKLATQRCEAIKHKDYYQTSKTQTCETASTHRPVSDLCPSGWKPQGNK